VTTPATGGASATGPEMGRFLLALLNGGELGGVRVLSRASVDQMFSRQFSSHSGLPGVTYGFFEHMEQGQRGLLREGTGVGVNSRIFLVPEHNFGFFVAHNSKGEELSAELTSAILEYFFPASDPPATPTVASVPLYRFTGQYRYVQYSRHTMGKVGSLLAGRVAVKSEADNALLVTPLGMGDPYGGFEETSRWLPVEPLLFQREDGKAYMAFGVDGQGRITHLFSGAGYHGSFERLVWYQTPIFHLCLALLLLVVFAVILVGSVLGRVPGLHVSGSAALAMRLLAGTIALLAILFVSAALPVAFTAGAVGGFPSITFIDAPNVLVQTLLLIPAVLMALTAGLGGVTLLLYVKGASGRQAGLLLTCVAGSLLGYLHYWRLLFI